MAGRAVGVMASIGHLFRGGSVVGLDDGQLLERFAARRDEVAFAALVALHGPMVLGICRRILRDRHDVEDAFQATFLVLVKRAGSIRDPGRLGPWLHGVARRVAMRARAVASRRQSLQGPPGSIAIVAGRAASDTSRAEGDEVLGVIDEEVARLPSRYRDAVVLCDLEGRSYAEAARRLSCPMGTLQSRLARGRARLRSRLVRRGVAPLTLAAVLAEGARAAVPDAIAEATLRAATAGAVSASTVALAGPVARSPVVSTARRVAGVLLLGSVVIGAGLVARDRLLAGPTAPLPAPGPLDGQPQPPPPRKEQPSPRAERTLRLEVVDGNDRSPLAGASVLVRITRGRTRTTQGTTDDEGRFPIALSGDTTYFLHVVVAHPGFVPIELRWGGGEIPDVYTLPMPRGVTIGGVVRDEQGRPIAGVRVFPQFVGPGPGRPAMYASMGQEIAAAVTDDQGRWRSDALPATAGPDARLGLEFTHPDHFKVESRITAEEARRLSGLQVMKAGAAVSGTVLSPTGRPVAGAALVFSGRSGSGPLVRLRTDEQGRFYTGRSVPPDQLEVSLSVQAEGFASAIRRITATPGLPPQVIKLDPRRPMRGRVVDSRGRPVPGAAVASTEEVGNGAFDWEVETDADGRFVWFEAPAHGPVYLGAYKAPFEPAVGRRFEAGSEGVTITLHRPQHLHGTVTDAETGGPIGRFTVVIGWGPHVPGGRPEWLHGNPNNKTFTDGRYDIAGGLFPDQGQRRSIRIEADGYLPGEFLGFLDNVEDIAHDFKLRRAGPLTGIVRGPDGRPIAGADIALSNSDNYARIKNGRLEANRVVGEALHTKTDADGRFRFQPQEKPVWVVVAHDAGFAARSPEELAGSTDITLAPWARVEGVMKIGRAPARGQKAAAWLLELGFRGRVDYDTRTDGSGRFVFERVMPGRLGVYRYVDDANQRGWTASNPVDVKVKPGETARVQIGGTGRPVVGRLRLPEGTALADLTLAHGGRLETERPEVRPDDYFEWDDERRSEWWDTYRKTPEGRAYFANAERQYALDLRPDGTFRIEDVPAGRYVLRLPFEGRTEGDRGGRRAFARVDVLVPDIPGGRSDEPLDLGTIPLEVFPFRELNAGDRAPTIPSRAADGRPLDLVALRGKFVLLAFWAAQDRGTMPFVAALKGTHEAFGRDHRLVMIGLNQDVAAEVGRRYATRHGMAWEHRYLGSRYDPSPIAAAFGLRAPPAAFLIGPDGRIIARDLEGDAIKQAVAGALKAEPRPQPQ